MRSKKFSFIIDYSTHIINENYTLLKCIVLLPTFLKVKRLLSIKHFVMNGKIVKRRFISGAQIQQINEATIVMRHFIHLSGRLLPYFNDLSSKEMLQPHELSDRIKIIQVFKEYKFDTFTSEILMDSKILEIIFHAYEEIEKRIPGNDSDADSCIDKFETEFSKLKNNWNKTLLN